MKLEKALGRVCLALHDSEAKRVTLLLSPALTVKATRRQKRRSRTGSYSEVYVVTVGRPNHREAKLIKLCVKAGVPFPVRKLQFTSFPVKRKPKV